MTDTKTTITETDNNEDRKEPSDARIILGPLVKYAAVGFVIVSIIITTAVMLDRQFNDIDREVAELQAQLAQAKDTSVVAADSDTVAELQDEATPTVEATAVQQEPAVAEVTEAEKPAAAVVENAVDTVPAMTQTAATVVTTKSVVKESSVADDAVVDHAVANKANRRSGVFDRSFDQIIAERNNYLKAMDRAYMEELRASQEKHYQMMRRRLARKEQRIQEMEKRNQEIYDTRASSIEEMQQMREGFLPGRI